MTTPQWTKAQGPERSVELGGETLTIPAPPSGDSTMWAPLEEENPTWNKELRLAAPF